jgi:CHAT domain-containing protein
MVTFYEHLAKDEPVEEALRAAHGALASQPAAGHPSFWAGSVAVIGPG